MLNPNEKILVEIVRASSKNVAAVILEDYIQSNGFLSDEAGDIIKKLLEEKANKPEPKSNIEQIIEEIENLPDTIYSDSIMDVTGVSWKHMKDKVIEIIKKYTVVNHE